MNDKEKLSCLTDRPCTACKFHKEEGCSKWSCVFEEKSGVSEREKETDIEGEWRTDKQGFTYCTLCKFKKIHNDGRSYKFCPWCGKPMITAYMRGGKE